MRFSNFILMKKKDVENECTFYTNDNKLHIFTCDKGPAEAL